MGFHRSDASSGPIALPPELVAMIEARVRQDGITPQEALDRCLPEWRAQREQAKKAPPPSTTNREHFPSHPTHSDRAGSDLRP